MMMEAVQQLTGLTQTGPMDRFMRPVSCWTRPWWKHHSWAPWLSGWTAFLFFVL